MASDNISLGKFMLDGIPPAPRGVPQIEVSYAIDANGIVTVSAKDKATGKEQHITISNANKLSKDDIESMKKQAEDFLDQDKKRMEEVETKNRADTLLYTAKKTITDFKGKVDAPLIEDAEKSIQDLEEALKNNKIDELQVKMEDVSQKISKIGEQAYKQQPQPETPTGEPEQPNQNGNDEPTVDGNAKEV
jgi:molecular chaperone DnaK